MARETSNVQDAQTDSSILKDDLHDTAWDADLDVTLTDALDALAMENKMIPEAVVPEAVAHEVVVFEAVVPGAVVAEALIPEAVVPEAVVPEAVLDMYPVSDQQSHSAPSTQKPSAHVKPRRKISDIKHVIQNTQQRMSHPKEPNRVVTPLIGLEAGGADTREKPPRIRKVRSIIQTQQTQQTQQKPEQKPQQHQKIHGLKRDTKPVMNTNTGSTVQAIPSVYQSPLAEYTTGNNTSMITPDSCAIENDRHLYFLDEMKSNRVVQGSSSSTRGENNHFLYQLGVALGVVKLDVSTDTSSVLTAKELEEARRDVRIRLSMDDPGMGEVHRKAHQLFVAGAPLTDMRANGVSIQHLYEIGVKFDDWSQRCDFGLKELAFMQGTWHDAVLMGFEPRHIVEHREKNGPSVLASPPFNLTWDNLEEDLGVTIEEAVLECKFTTADFAVLKETIDSMVRRGFSAMHATQMGESPNNFEISLGATREDISHLFPDYEMPTEMKRATPFDTRQNSDNQKSHGETNDETSTKSNTRNYLVKCRNKAGKVELTGAKQKGNARTKKQTGSFDGFTL